MSNPDLLLEDLQMYQQDLHRHINRVQDEFQHLQKRWIAFHHVYEGEAAEKFQVSWSRTLAWVQDHLTQLQSLSAILQVRIDALQQATHTGGD